MGTFTGGPYLTLGKLTISRRVTFDNPAEIASHVDSTQFPQIVQAVVYIAITQTDSKARHMGKTSTFLLLFSFPIVLILPSSPIAKESYLSPINAFLNSDLILELQYDEPSLAKSLNATTRIISAITIGRNAYTIGENRASTVLFESIDGLPAWWTNIKKARESTLSGPITLVDSMGFVSPPRAKGDPAIPEAIYRHLKYPDSPEPLFFYLKFEGRSRFIVQRIGNIHDLSSFYYYSEPFKARMNMKPILDSKIFNSISNKRRRVNVLKSYYLFAGSYALQNRLDNWAYTLYAIKSLNDYDTTILLPGHTQEDVNQFLADIPAIPSLIRNVFTYQFYAGSKGQGVNLLCRDNKNIYLRSYDFVIDGHVLDKQYDCKSSPIP